MKAGNLFGLDFFTFRMLITGVCLLIIYKSIIKRYSHNSNYVILLYMIYQMIIDSEHFRNFISMTILLVAIRFLEKNLYKDKIKFLILVLIASSIHTAFILYTPLVFANTKSKNRLIKGIAIGTIFFTIIIFLNNNRIPFLQLIINIIDDQKIIGYLSSKTNLGFLIPVVLHLTSVVLVWWSRRIITVKDSNTSIIVDLKDNGYSEGVRKIKDIELGNLIFWINIIMIIFFPLYMLSVTFYRLGRNVLLLNFSIYSIASNKIGRKNAYKGIFDFAVICSAVLWLIMDLIVKTSPETVLIPFFTRNLFFN